MDGHRLRFALALAVTGLLAAALVASAGLLAALPALAAFLPLLAGRYLGAERLERLIAARVAAFDRVAGRRARRPRAERTVPVPRGAGLLGSGLAKRPPPALATTH